MSNIVYTISIEYGSFDIRPDSLLCDLIKNTDLTIEDFTLVSVLFGRWTYEVSDNKKNDYLIAKQLIYKRLVNLFNQGMISGGEMSSHIHDDISNLNCFLD